jgi:hypothetical protein
LASRRQSTPLLGDVTLREAEVLVRYVGADVVEVPGVGVFQRGTEAMVPKRKALELLASDDWAHVSRAQPAVQLVLRTGPWDGPVRSPAPGEGRPRDAPAPDDPSAFGDLPSDGPAPADR